MNSYISETKHGEIVIDASELNSGVYILQLDTGSLILTRKLVLEK